MRHVFVLLVAIAAFGACGPKNYDYPYSKEPDPRGKEIELGVGDVLSINVWDQKDLNTEGTIRPDGTITMPLIGDVKAVGITPTALRDKIKAQLANFVKIGGGNEITVAVKSWKSYRFQVQGEVTKPGVFTSDEYVTVSGAIALAGGPTRFADRDGVVVLRKDASTGQTRRIPISYDLIASGKRLDMDIWILSGDILFVP
jgi:polysaccharide export outer membrane protein